MAELVELSDQEVVNLICELRPAAQTVPLSGEVQPVEIEWERLAAAEAEMQQRGYSETTRGYWETDDVAKPYLIQR